MREHTGSPSIYHTRLPHQWKLERMKDISKEAKTRLKWMDNYRKHGNARLTCRHFDISPTTFYKWLKRFNERGLRGLESLSRTPKRKRVSHIPWQTVDLIVKIRREYPAWSKHKIAVILRRDHNITLSASSVGRILKRKGLYDERRSRKRRSAARRRAKKKRAERWLRDLYPGSLVQIDTKHLRFSGDKYYQFTAIDSFSRISFVRIFSTASSLSGKNFLGELKDFMPFDLHGIQTDNGSEYLKYFDEALNDEGIDHYFTYPNCPKQNARVERKIQTSELELWDFNAGYSLPELNELADRWNHTYNYVRPHQSLGYLTPVEHLMKWRDNSETREKVSTM